MQVQNAQKVCDRFGLGELLACHPLGGTRNHNFIFHTQSGRWFVRQRFAGYCREGQVDFDHDAMRFLYESHIPVPLPENALNGQSWWHDGEAAWEVLSFVEGQHFRDGNREEIQALGETLAQWHQAGRQFPQRYLKATPRGETDPPRLRERLEQIQKETPEAAGILATYRDAIEESATLLPDNKYFALPQTLIHGDVQPANILVRDGQIAAFVDLDWCAWQVRIYDLCFAILLCCATHAEPFDGGDIWSLTQQPHLSSDNIAVLLQAYEKVAGLLTPEEKQALRPQLILTWCHVRLSGSLKAAAEERTRFLQRLPDIRDASWLPLYP